MANAEEPKVGGDTSEAPFDFDTVKDEAAPTPPTTVEGDQSQPTQAPGKTQRLTMPGFREAVRQGLCRIGRPARG